MHSALLAGLASQHAEELQTEAATRQRRTAGAVARPGEPPPSITQRAGWALIQAGLWLAVRQAGA
jgi:hypothetical protein